MCFRRRLFNHSIISSVSHKIATLEANDEKFGRVEKKSEEPSNRSNSDPATSSSPASGHDQTVHAVVEIENKVSEVSKPCDSLEDALGKEVEAFLDSHPEENEVPDVSMEDVEAAESGPKTEASTDGPAASKVQASVGPTQPADVGTFDAVPFGPVPDSEFFKIPRSKLEAMTEKELFGVCDYIKRHEFFQRFLEQMKSELGEDDFQLWSFGDNGGDPLEDANDFLMWARKLEGIEMENDNHASQKGSDGSSDHPKGDSDFDDMDMEHELGDFEYPKPPSAEYPDINNVLRSSAKAF